jgi:hypothetical protein
MNKGQILEQYFNTKEKLDSLSKEVESLRNIIKDFGDCTANGYRSFVDEQERRSISLLDIEKKDQGIYKSLLDKQLVKTNTILIVKVKRV